MKSTYQTQQRKIILSFLASAHDRQFTIDEMIEGLNREGHNVAQSSVYRLMKKLVEEGVVRRHSKEDSRQYVYQIIESEECHSHLHLQCTECGKLVHLSHEATKEARQWMQGATGFELDQEKTYLYGRCTDCKKRGQ
ncbi:MAG: transcriptional repressor [Lachnospiraceae bacterium]|nr:transcriptional repressor [Lachnospiraceae bacterium]